MKNDIFISYSSVDKHVADAVCSTLENNGVRCWIAPRDIIPGSDWAQSIINAINSSKIMVLIFSQNSNKSSQVTKELNLAVSHNLMVVPFKIDDSKPSGSMEYFLADMHWLDAINGDMQEQINKLKDILISVLPHNIKGEEIHSERVAKSEIKSDNKASVQSEIKTENPPKTENAPFVGEKIPLSSENTPKTNKNKSVGFIKAYTLLWQRCFDYKGCASRAEYWKAVLMNIIASFAVLIINVFAVSEAPVLILLYLYASAVAFISLSVRRLHDTNHSGHWMWLFFTGYGSFVPFVFFCFKGVDKGNRFKKL